APIDLASGQRRPFARSQPVVVVPPPITQTDEGEDAPRRGERVRSPSQVIEAAFLASAEIGEGAQQGKTPTKAQLDRLHEGVAMFKGMRSRIDQLDQLLAVASGGRGGWRPVLLSVMAALGISVGWDGVSNADDVAQAKVLSET